MVFKKFLLFSITLVIYSCQSQHKTTAVAHSLDSAIAEYEKDKKHTESLINQAPQGQHLLTVPDEITQATRY